MPQYLLQSKTFLRLVSATIFADAKDHGLTNATILTVIKDLGLVDATRLTKVKDLGLADVTRLTSQRPWPCRCNKTY